MNEKNMPTDFAGTPLLVTRYIPREIERLFFLEATLYRSGDVHVVVDGVEQGREVIERHAALYDRLGNSVRLLNRKTVYELRTLWERNPQSENRFANAIRDLDPDTKAAPKNAQEFVSKFLSRSKRDVSI